MAPDDTHAIDEAPARCWNQIGVWGNGSCPELREYLHCRGCPVYAAAAAGLLDREPPAGYRHDWTVQVAREQHTTAPGTAPVVAFRIGAEWLALPVSVFQGATERRPMIPLPHRGGGATLGLTNVNGELLICVSLAQLLGITPQTGGGDGTHAAGEHAFTRLLIVNGGGGRITFPVDEVHGIHRYHPHDLREVPETLAKAGTRFTRGLVSWNDTVLACLDDGLVFYAIDKELA